MGQGDFKDTELESVVPFLSNGQIVENEKEFSRWWVADVGEGDDRGACKAGRH